MAGILANSATVTMVAGDTAVTKTVTGYMRGERITLSTTPVGTTYLWSLSRPLGSSSARCYLEDTDSVSTSFVPDIEGAYVVNCTVDGTAYKLTASALDVSISNTLQILRLEAIADATVPTPSGATLNLYNSSTQGGLAIKAADGSISTIDVTVVP